MEIAICTRCQSNNPVFTKFCLTCGLAITAEMKRSVVVSSSSVAAQMAPVTTGVSKVALSNEPVSATTATPLPTTESQTEQPANQPQAKGGGWLKSLFSK